MCSNMFKGSSERETYQFKANSLNEYKGSQNLYDWLNNYYLLFLSDIDEVITTKAPVQNIFHLKAVEVPRTNRR